MHKTKEAVEKLCSLKNQIVCWAELNTEIPVPQMGQVVDMIKDLSDAEEKLWKACYYHKLVEEMEHEKENGERYGYDNWRYSSGRFAPTGRGHRSGYPLDDPRLWSNDPHADFLGGRMGYPDRGSSDGMASGRDGGGSGNRQGYVPDGYRVEGQDSGMYGRYREAKRHYTESKSPADKDAMSHSARMYLGESIETMRDIWKDADPELKKKMKEDLGALYKELAM